MNAYYFIPVSRRRIIRFLSGIIGIMFIVTMILVPLKSLALFRDNPVYAMLENFFHFNGEANLPAWFSSFLLLIAGALLGVIAGLKTQTKDIFCRHWKWLAVIFLIMAIDETAQIHESLSYLLSVVLPTTLWFFEKKFVFFLIGTPAALILGLVFFRFLTHLPPVTKRLFIVAAAVYIGGALGLEVISNTLDHLHTSYFWFRFAQSMEEVCEMSGIALFIHALLLYLEKDSGKKEIRFILK